MRNGPSKGESVRVEPIRSLAAIRRIRKLIEDRPRELCLFTVGINTALRANELLSLQVGDVSGLSAGESLAIKERKTGKTRRITVNEPCVAAIKNYLHSRRGAEPSEPFFVGQRGRITVQYLNRLVKKWCADAGVTEGNYGSHTLRKTWGYHQRVTFKADLPLIMAAYGHSSQRITLAYLGIQPKEIESLYLNSL